MSQFNNAESNNNAFWYDKNEYYAEYGLAVNTKKDSKSRSMKELEKAEQRKKKVDDLVSSLPNKMQKKIAHVASTLPKKPSEPSKSTKQINYVSRQNTSEDVAYNQDDYEEEEEEKENVSIGDEYREGYQEGLKMWQRYGFTKEQYDADLEHREDIAALDAFENDPENYHASPDYGEALRRKIQKFEDYIEAKEREHDLLYPDYPDENDLVHNFDAVADEVEICCWELYEAEILDNYRAIVAADDQEDEADIAERYREDRLESAIENALDDMRDD